MQGSPQRKRARFSQHPQIFQYSSKSKKQNQTDNDSLLLDMNEEQGRSQQKIYKVQERQQIDSNAERQLDIDQITSDLAQIQAYLQQQSKPIAQPQVTKQQISLTPLKTGSDNFNINFRPQLRSGRETMSLEQEIRVRSTIKQMQQQDQISNNKKRALNEEGKDKQRGKLKTQERIAQQVKKNKRITMDVKELMGFINQYKDEDDQRKIREQRKNRITMDVYALSKFLQDVEEEDQSANPLKTPIKTLEKSVKKTKVFSAFKETPHSTQVKLFVKTYLSQASRRLQEKQQFSKKLCQHLNQLKSQLVKMDLKLSDARKRAERRAQQKQLLERNLKSMTQQLNKRKYMEDIVTIKNIEEDLCMRILKCSVEENGCYGHFIFDGVYMKAKAKGKLNGIQIKLSTSAEAKQNEKSVFISAEESVKLLRKHSTRLQQKNEAFLESVVKIRKGNKKLKKLQRDIYYLSLGFELKEFEVNYLSDKVSFQVFIGSNRFFLFEINMAAFLNDETDPSCVCVYDPAKPGYLNIEIEPKPLDSIVHEKMKKIIALGVV